MVEPTLIPVALKLEDTVPAVTTTQEAAPRAAKGAASNSPAPTLVDLHLLPANIETQIGEMFFVMASVAGQANINEAHLLVHFDATALQFVGARNSGLLGETTNLRYDLHGNQVTLHLQPRVTTEIGVEARGNLFYWNSKPSSAEPLPLASRA